MADQYLMEDLKDAASSRIGKALNRKNIFDTSHLAEKFGAVALSEKCAEFIFENASTIEDEKLDEMKEGVVMVSLAKKFVQESKRDNWMTKLFGKSTDFKQRKDFGAEEDYVYKGYVMSRIKPKMFVSCNKLSSWQSPQKNRYSVKEGHIGFVLKTDSSSSVEVKWLTIPNTGDPASCLIGSPSTGPLECLDLLSSPVPQL